MSKKSMWSLKFNTAALVLIPAAVGINYIGKMFAGVLKLPLWLDAIGTALAGILAGPIIGGICGATNNIIYGLTMDPMSAIYALTNLAIGIVIGILAHKGMLNSFGKAVMAGLIVALTAALISTPLNIKLWGGQTGNIWGDAVYAYMIAHHAPVWISSFIDEIIVDIPDKIAVLLIATGIYKGLPKKLTILYKNDNETETL